MQAFEQIFPAMTGLKLETGVSLAAYSSFKIGGLARFFTEVTNLDQLVKAIGTARQYRFPFYLIGGGYNLLFDDAGYQGLIIRNKASALSYLPDQGLLAIDSGSDLQTVVKLTVSSGLTGLEFLAGIPGTVGGAIYGNAGAFGQAIGEKTTGVLTLDSEGQPVSLSQASLAFSYRSSNFKKNHQPILKVFLSVIPGEKDEVDRAVKGYLDQRSRRHPPRTTACAGSYFKNPVLPDGQRLAAG